MTISFGIVFFILAKFGFPVITKAVEKRQQHIAGSLEAARKAEEQLAALNKQAEAILDKAHEQRNSLLNEAEEQRKEMVLQAREKTAAEVQQKLKQAHDEIEESRRRVMAEARSDIAAISIKIAEKVLGEQLENADRQQALINRYLNEEVKTE